MRIFLKFLFYIYIKIFSWLTCINGFMRHIKITNDNNSTNKNKEFNYEISKQQHTIHVVKNIEHVVQVQSKNSVYKLIVQVYLYQPEDNKH
jgi:hypothetical protein